MLFVAVDWELYKRTNSALALGFVGLSHMASMLFCTLPAGHVADNFNRKRVILLTTLLIGREFEPDVRFRVRRAGDLHFHLPVRAGRGADVFVAGERVVSAAFGFARGIPARRDLQHRHVSTFIRDRAELPRRGHRADAAKRLDGLCADRIVLVHLFSHRRDD